VREKREKQMKQQHTGFALTEGARWEYEDLSKLRYDKILSHRPPELIAKRRFKKGKSVPVKIDPYVYFHSNQVEEIRLSSGEKRAAMSIELKMRGAMVMDESSVNWT